MGVLGAGGIGSHHARQLASRVSGAKLAALFDVDAERAGPLAAATEARSHRCAEELIEDPDVEAVVIASPDETHAELALLCIAAGKPVLCEKPLAPTAAEAFEVVAAEMAHGRRLVRLGFMRRYDKGYLALKAAVDAGRVGEVLVVHCLHRGPQAPEGWTSEMQFTNSAVHEFDVARWLLGEEVVAATVVPVRRSPHAAGELLDPQIVVLETSAGRVIDIELFSNCQYGYEVLCEVVGTEGTVSLDGPAGTTIAYGGMRQQAVARDWRTRFEQAYLDELQDWVDAVRAGEARGPSVWDGYAATAVAQSCVQSLSGKGRSEVSLVPCPGMFA